MLHPNFLFMLFAENEISETCILCMIMVVGTLVFRVAAWDSGNIDRGFVHEYIYF